MIQATKRILCSAMAGLFLLNSCAPVPSATPAPAATENPALVRLQQTVDAMLATQKAQATPTPDSLLASQTAPSKQTEDPLQQMVEAISDTQIAQQATQQNIPLQQTVEAMFATLNAQATQQRALEGPTSTQQPALDIPTPDTECGAAAAAPGVTATAPAIENLYPSGGETYGGKLVTIAGKNLISQGGEKAIFCFGDFLAKDVTCPSAELCTMKTPRNPKAGLVIVQAIVGGQRGTEPEAFEFEYLDPPKVDSVEPNSGPISGGISVTINGSGFTDNTKFFFGPGNQARTEKCSSSGSECTVISPGIKSSQETVVWVQAVKGGAFSELDKSPGTTQTFKYVARAKYACDALLIAPGSQGPFRPNESLEIKWVVKNIGANAWPAGLDVKFSSGSSGNMGTVSVVEIKKALQPNDTATIAIDAKAPAKKGLHHMTWIVAGQGCSLYVAIKVE